MTQQLCSTPEQLLAFLRGHLNTSEQSELQKHLDECESCRLRLENTAADGHAWKEAEQFLAGTPDSDLFDEDSCASPGYRGSIQVQHVLDSLGPTDDPHSLGRIGGYEVTGVIGAGGMGVVLKAHERSLDRIVAIKVMAPHLASSGSARKRFAREAKAAAAVIHPNVVAIHGVSNDGSLPYLVMPFIGGASLQWRLDNEGPLSALEVLRLGSQIAAGLSAAHGQGLVHRDIKPANILLDNGVERVSITDFGLARAVDDASMTRTGVIAGTPQFMSPEQARGQSIDHRSDLFSLGSVLYTMCTGRAPFRAETSYGVLRRITDDEPKPIREINAEIPAWLCQIISKLMEKSHDDRFDSASEVAELLEECLAHVQQPTITRLPESLAEHDEESFVVKLVKSLGIGNSRRSAKSLDDFRYPPVGKLIATAAFAFSLVFAGVLIVMEMNKGTLTIESDVDGIPIRILKGTETVDELVITRPAQSVRIAAGNYVVQVGGEFDDLLVQNGSVTLKRGANETVRIVRSDTKALEDSAKPSTGEEKVSPDAPDSDKAGALAFVQTIERLRREGKHREWFDLVEDDEIERFAGLALMSRAQAKVMQTMWGGMGDEIAKSDPEAARSIKMLAITDPMFRTDPPADATAAFNLLTGIAQTRMLLQIGGKPTNEQDVDKFQAQFQGMASYSQLLRSASGVLSDPRDFIAAVREYGGPVDSENEPTPSISWKIEVDGAHVIATDANKADKDNQSLSYLQLRKTHEGSWMVHKLVKEEDFQAMMMLMNGMPTESDESDKDSESAATDLDPPNLEGEIEQVLSDIDSLNQREDSGPNSPRSIRYGSEIQLLVSYGSAAVPSIIRELDRTQDDRMIATLAFALRALGDNRCVPAIIRAIPRTAVPMTKCNWIKGDSTVDKDLAAFFRKHKFKGQGNASKGGCSDGWTELSYALSELTGKNYGFSRTYATGVPEQLYLQQKLLHDDAQRWAKWWNENSADLVTDAEFRVVNLPPFEADEPEKLDPNKTLAKIPIQRSSQLQALQIVADANKQARSVFLDLDTGRSERVPEQWRGKRLSDSDRAGLFIWAEQEEFDLFCDQRDNSDGSQSYVIRGLGIEAWQLDEDRWKNQSDYASLNELKSEGKKVKGKWLIPFDEEKQELDPKNTAPFLVMTREGCPMLIYVGVEITELASSDSFGDDLQQATGFVLGRKLAIMHFEPLENGKTRTSKTHSAGESRFLVDDQTTTGNLLSGTWEIELHSPGKPKRGGFAAFAGSSGMIASPDDGTDPLRFSYVIQPHDQQLWIDIRAENGADNGGSSLWQGIVEASPESITLCFARADRIKQHGRPESCADADTAIYETVLFLRKTTRTRAGSATRPVPEVHTDGATPIPVIKYQGETMPPYQNSIESN